MRDPKERLRDILEATAAIDRYRERDRSAFDQDEPSKYGSFGVYRLLVRRRAGYPRKSGISPLTFLGAK